METIIMNPIKFKKRKIKFKKRGFKLKKIKLNKKYFKKGGKIKMKRKRSSKGKGILSQLFFKAPKVKRKVRKPRISLGGKTRPVFYEISKSTIKRSPFAKKHYKKITNPINFIKRNLNDVVSIMPDVVYAGAGYIGVGYVERLVKNTTGFTLPDNPVIRQIGKTLITIGVSTLANMWNKRAGKMVFLGGLLNVAQDIWNSYEIFKLIPIQVPSLPAPTSTKTLTSNVEESGQDTIISDSSFDTLITNSGEEII